MEERNYNIYEDNEDEEGNEYEDNLPISQISGQRFSGLLKINQIYAKQLAKICNSDNRYKKITLPYNDMKVLNSLLKENYLYLTMLLRYRNFRIEFDTLYSISVDILNLLGLIEQIKVNIYQKLQKLKFMELKFKSLRISGRPIDFSDADALLNEMESIQYDSSLSNYITDLDISTVKLNKALIKFCIGDFELAKEYALTTLEILDKFNPLKNPKNKIVKKNPEDEEKYIKKLSQAHEFLAEVYDLEKDYKNALSNYEKCYYLYIGRYGLNHPLITPIKKKKEIFEKKVYDMNMENNRIEYEDEFITKLKAGKIVSSKGQTPTFSFVIPVTKIVEPLLISIYALPEYIDNKNDFYTHDLFLKSIYLDKTKLFNYLGFMDGTQNDNYLLYTDESLNIILQNITLVDNKYISFSDSRLYNICINC